VVVVVVIVIITIISKYLRIFNDKVKMLNIRHTQRPEIVFSVPIH